MLADVDIGALGEAHLNFQTITMAFLPDEVEQIEGVWGHVKKELAGSKTVWLTRLEEYDAFLDTLEAASESYQIKNTATALMIVLEVVTRHLGEFSHGWMEDGKRTQVPVSTALGFDKMPIEAARTLKRAVDRAVDSGEVDERWKALAQWSEA